MPGAPGSGFAATACPKACSALLALAWLLGIALIRAAARAPAPPVIEAISFQLNRSYLTTNGHYDVSAGMTSVDSNFLNPEPWVYEQLGRPAAGLKAAEIVYERFPCCHAQQAWDTGVAARCRAQLRLQLERDPVR